MGSPCLERLDADCFRSHPAWAKRAFAYRLVHLLTPKPLTKRLPRALRRPLLAPGVEMPPGVDIPPGTVIGPGVQIPPGWQPGDLAPPGITIPPGTVFPPGWTPGDPVPDGVTLDPGATFPPGWTPGDPLPPGAFYPPTVPPGVDESGANPPTYTEPWSPGPAHPSPGGAPAVEHGSGIYYPAASGDDGTWIPASFFTSAWDYLQFGKSGANRWDCYITFNDVEAPQGSTIIEAKITLYAIGPGTDNPVNSVIYGNDVDNPTNPTNSTEADALALTSASVAWNPGVWDVTEYYDTPDIKTILQEIVNRAGWVAGNNIMILLKGTASSVYHRSPGSWDADPLYTEAALHVEW